VKIHTILDRFQKTDSFPPDPAMKARFLQERLRFLNQAVRLFALLTMVFFPAFCVLDSIFKPALFYPLLYLRLFVVAVTVPIFALTWTAFGRARAYGLGAFQTLLVSGSIAFMCLMDAGPRDPYYASMTLPILGFGILLPTTFAEGAPVLVVSWLAYCIPNGIGISAQDAPLFLNNNFFLVSTILISLVTSRFHLAVRKREWLTRFRLEQAHRKIHRHSRDLEARVQHRTQQLIQSERLAVIGQLAGGIAHDFNNHLTAILGASEMLLTDPELPKPARQDIQSIFGAGERASELVRQLLAFSRQKGASPKAINLNDAIRDVRKLLPRLIGEDIDLVIQTAGDLCPVRIDPIHADQILLNLAVNARDAMPRGGRLLIETENARLERAYLRARPLTVPPGPYVMLAVSDNGQGMDDEVKRRMFEPFFTTKKSKGTGLGLATVHGIVKQAHGDIIVYSEWGVGTTIKIFLPAQVAKTPGERRKSRQKRMPRGRETILLVEDELSVRELTARLLKLQGYRVIQARDGKEALARASGPGQGIDLLMTDVVLPTMNGPELAERLLKDHSHLKVLYFSGYTDAFVMKKGILKQGSHFLQKPFTFEDLSCRVRSAIDQTKPPGRGENSE
jgi:signal transduction histidine kinase/CheY-like chemotaxis protein